MVKVTSIILASFAVAPIAFAAPAPALNTEQPTEIAIRSDIEDTVLEARAPNPAPWKLLRKFRPAAIMRAAAPILRKAMPLVSKAAPFVQKALPYAGMAARLVLRDENGDIYVRDIDLSDLTERDFEELGLSLDARGFEDADDFELEMREPKFRPKKLLKKGRALAGKAARFSSFVANPTSAALALAAREFDDDELFDAREYFEDIEDIETREPKRRKKNKNLEARDIEDDLDDLFEREFEEYLSELEAREPRAKWRNTVARGRNIAGKALNTFDRVNSFLSGFNIRELEGEDFEMEARSLDELD